MKLCFANLKNSPSQCSCRTVLPRVLNTISVLLFFSHWYFCLLKCLSREYPTTDISEACVFMHVYWWLNIFLCLLKVTGKDFDKQSDDAHAFNQTTEKRKGIMNTNTCFIFYLHRIINRVYRDHIWFLLVNKKLIEPLYLSNR